MGSSNSIQEYRLPVRVPLGAPVSVRVSAGITPWFVPQSMHSPLNMPSGILDAISTHCAGSLSNPDDTQMVDGAPLDFLTLRMIISHKGSLGNGEKRDEGRTMKERVTMSNIGIILNRPKYSGNIGSVARCARNMAVTELVVVDPVEIDGEEIRKMATHAALDAVERIRYASSLREALAPFQFSVGTTGRSGGSNLRRSMVSSTELAETIAPLSRNNRIALVFGSEDRGLTNEALHLCNLIVTIPVEESFRSINLSHAVMIICYELFSYRGAESPGARVPRLASSTEVEAMYGSLKEMFLKIDFINAENPDYWMVAVRNLFSRTKLFSRDVKIIRGICRQVELYGRGRTSGALKEQKP